MAREKVILMHETLDTSKYWCLYKLTNAKYSEDLYDLVCWTRTKKELIQYAKENNLVITKK